MSRLEYKNKLQLSTAPTTVSFLIVATILIYLKPGLNQSLDRLQLSAILVVAFVCIGTHLVISNQKNWVRIDTLFILGYVMTYFQWPMLILLNGTYPDDSRFRASLNRNLMFATWLSAIFLVAWLVGYWMPQRHRMQTALKQKSPLLISFTTVAILIIFSIIAGRAFISGAVYKEATADVGLTGSVQGLAGYIYTIFQVLIVVVIAFAVSFLKTRLASGARIPREIIARDNVVVALLLAVSATYLLIAGERGLVVQLACALSIAVGATIRPLNFRWFALLSVVGAVVMTYVRYSRAGDAAMFAESFANNGYWDLSDNMARSLFATCIGMDMVGAHGGPFWGVYWVSNIAGVIPFAQKMLIATTGLGQSSISGATAITTFAYGTAPTSGLGTTWVGDLYMNAGVGLSIFIALFYGVVCRRFETYLSGNFGQLKFVAAVCFGSLAFYMPRAGVLAQLQPVAWGLAAAAVFMRAPGRIAFRSRSELGTSDKK